MKHLLIIGFVWPEPKSSAAGSRMMQLINAFKNNGYQLTFASPCSKTDNAVNLETLKAKGYGTNASNKAGIKILAYGELTKKLTIQASAISKTAQAKVEAAGGSVELAK